jgi:hypothetical protein
MAPQWLNEDLERILQESRASQPLPAAPDPQPSNTPAPLAPVPQVAQPIPTQSLDEALGQEQEYIDPLSVPEESRGSGWAPDCLMGTRGVCVSGGDQ